MEISALILILGNRFWLFFLNFRIILWISTRISILVFCGQLERMSSIFNGTGASHFSGATQVGFDVAWAIIDDGGIVAN